MRSKMIKRARERNRSLKKVTPKFKWNGGRESVRGKSKKLKSQDKGNTEKKKHERESARHLFVKENKE